MKKEQEENILNKGKQGKLHKKERLHLLTLFVLLLAVIKRDTWYKKVIYVIFTSLNTFSSLHNG